MKTLRTILVDDHEAFRKSLRKMLKDFSFIKIVGETSSAEDALDAANTKRPDLVIEDIRLPGMDGFELGRILKSRYPHIQLVFISLYGSTAHRSEAEKQGFPYIPKQWLLSELPGALEEITRRSDIHDTPETQDGLPA